MRRIIGFLLCFVILFCLVGCTKQQEKLHDPIEFYYLHSTQKNQIQHGSEHSVITPESREGLGLRRHPGLLLDQYLKGPKTEYVQSPFPSGTTLIEWTSDDAVLTIILSDEFAELSGIELTIACACITKTFLELGGFDTVIIQAETLMLDGKASITMNSSNLLLFDDTVPNEG